MSTLKVNTIQNVSAAHSSTPEQIAQGRAKAWVVSDSAGTMGDNFGISSVNEIGNGNEDYTVNFSSSFSNTNYCVCANCNNTDSSGGQVFIDTKLAGSFIANVRGTNGTNNTGSGFACVIFGD
tara:strand:- start:1141 stop:1509 length:369 start_codon:yes stop_codon:yes gene_type:complete